MKTFLTLFFLCHAVLAVKHSMKFFFTCTSGITNSPEFAAVAAIDEVEVGHCNSIIRRAELKEDWAKKLLKTNPQLLEWLSQECLVYQHFFMADIEVFKKRFNQMEGSHVLQIMSGCEWDDESHEIKIFEKWGYDGEDFISLDQQTMAWMTSKKEAVVIKPLWDADKERLDHTKYFYTSECPRIVQDYISFETTFLHRTERSPVSLLQKTPSSLVSCHATGFYPHRADLFWRKDGEEIHEGVEKGQILPNNDGTFQMSSGLNVSLIKHEDWRRYDCVFQLSGLKEDIITTLDKAKIRTNSVSSSEFLIGPAIGGAVGVLLLLMLSGVSYCCWRQRNDFHLVHGDPGKEGDVSADELNPKRPTKDSEQLTNS